MITGYLIKYRIKGAAIWNQTLVKAPKMEFTLGGLKPYTFCEFQVVAVNDAGESRPGEIRYWPNGQAGI